MRRKVEQEGYLQNASKSGSSSLPISHSFVKSTNPVMTFPHHSPDHAQLLPLSPVNYTYISDTHRVSGIKLTSTNQINTNNQDSSANLILIGSTDALLHGSAF